MMTARYMLHLVEPLFLRLTQDNLTDHIDIKMRTLSLSWACSMGRWGISSGSTFGGSVIYKIDTSAPVRSAKLW